MMAFYLAFCFLVFLAEMKSFTKANMEDSLEFTWSLFIILLIVNCFIGSVLALAVMWEMGIGVGFGLFLLEYAFLGRVLLIFYFLKKYCYFILESFSLKYIILNP